MVTILTVTLLIIIFAGVTYAFFTANNPEGSTASINSTSGKMTITYTDGKSSLLVSENVQPSDKIIIDKTFTLTGTNTTSGLAMPYKIGIKFKNEFSYNQLYYYIKRVSENENITTKLIGEANQTIPGHETETGYTKGTFIKNSDETYLELANGEFKANTNNQTITFNLKIQFPDNNENQDSEKGKSFTGYIVVNNEEKTAVDYIVNLYNQDKENNGLMMDDTEDYNIRYRGSNDVVKNYVEFGNDGELWRIIGIFDVKDNENGEYHKKIKIVRNSPLGGYSWDTSDVSINDGFGDNDWNKADLMQELNGDYLDTNLTMNSYWYNGTDSERQLKTAVFDYKNVIKNKYQNLISESIWNLGGISSDSQSVKKYYQEERGNLKASLSKPLFWKGKVGLIYASDYGYASTSNQCHNNDNNINCTNENWLENLSFWTLTTTNFNNIYPIAIRNNYVSRANAFANYYSVFPSVFLKSSVEIVDGNGYFDTPFIIN